VCLDNLVEWKHSIDDGLQRAFFQTVEYKIHRRFLALRITAGGPRSVKSPPRMVDSSRFHPVPMPNRNLPPQASSSVAICLAVRIGLRSGTRQIPVPSLRRLVVTAALANAINGSGSCQTKSGSRSSCLTASDPSEGPYRIFSQGCCRHPPLCGYNYFVGDRRPYACFLALFAAPTASLSEEMEHRLSSAVLERTRMGVPVVIGSLALNIQLRHAVA
jgi:hypothetical protein